MEIPDKIIAMAPSIAQSEAQMEAAYADFAGRYRISKKTGGGGFLSASPRQPT
jgi:hypothetical protein